MTEIVAEDRPATWSEYYKRRAGIATEMEGAHRFFIENPEHATDEARARAFDRYAERIAAVALPAEASS